MKQLTSNLNTNFNKIYTLDTNIILHDAHNIEMLSDGGNNLICIPEVVIDELDSKKSGFEEINFQAREFGRILENAKVEAFKKVKTKTGEYSIIETTVEKDSKKITLHMVSKKDYINDKNNTKVNILNDRKILEIAEFIQNEYGVFVSEDFEEQDKIMLSLDILARTRGISMGLNVDALVNNKNDESFDFSFTKTIPVESIYFNSYEHKPILDLDPEYKPGIYSYELSGDEGSYMKYGIIKNGQFHYIDEEEIIQQYVTPKGVEQKFLSAALLDPYYDIVAVDSQAGTGKTLLSVSAAIKNVKKGRQSKIVYIRNSVESVDLKSEDIGFLPGSIDEKLKVYNHALYDSLEHIARTEVNKKVNNKNEDAVTAKMDELLVKYKFETMWPGELRGRTIQESFVIIDEAQNFSKKGLATVLSRIDASCKVVVLGNWKQVDNSYLNKYSNGLTHLLSLMSEDYDDVNLFAIELTKVLRGPITKWVEEIYNKQTK
jgi:PhoH-like ATPase